MCEIEMPILFPSFISKDLRKPDALQPEEQMVYHDQALLEIGGRCLVQFGLSKWVTATILSWNMDSVTVSVDGLRREDMATVISMPWSRVYDNSREEYQIGRRS